MTTPTPRFKFGIVDARRALRVAKDSGLVVVGFKITAAGDFIVMTGTGASEPVLPVAQGISEAQPSAAA